MYQEKYVVLFLRFTFHRIWLAKGAFIIYPTPGAGEFFSCREKSLDPPSEPDESYIAPPS